MDLIKDILIIIVAIPIFIWAFMNAIPIFLFIIGGLSHMLSNLWDKNHILMFKDGTIEGSIFAAVKICVMFFIIFISAFIDINTVRVLNLINGFFLFIIVFDIYYGDYKVKDKIYNWFYIIRRSNRYFRSFVRECYIFIKLLIIYKENFLWNMFYFI